MAKVKTSKPTSDAVDEIKLVRLDKVPMNIQVVGTAPLIVNQWSAKARQMMLAKQMSSGTRSKKVPKDPKADYEASKYKLLDGSDGMPSVAFKAAIVGAARLFEGVTLVQLKTAISVRGQGLDPNGNDLVRLEYDSVDMREDTPRNATGVADLRYRAMYMGWSCTLHVSTIAGQIGEDSVLSLVDAAGLGGVGEWRPSSPKSHTGTFGTFEIEAS